MRKICKQCQQHNLWAPEQNKILGLLLKKEEKIFLPPAVSRLTSHGVFYLLFSVTLPWGWAVMFLFV